MATTTIFQAIDSDALETSFVKNLVLEKEWLSHAVMNLDGGACDNRSQHALDGTFPTSRVLYTVDGKYDAEVICGSCLMDREKYVDTMIARINKLARRIHVRLV
jgi:hypothetical protein